jgi:hypothetical protein
VNAGVIALISDRAILLRLKPNLLREVAEDPVEDTRPESARVLTDISEMWREVRRGEALPVLSSTCQARRLHDELVREINRHGIRWTRRHIYPPPPIPGMTLGDTRITPITTVDDLQAQGRAQHNCVASYARRVLAGNTYIYRVTVRGDVCTLAISRSLDGFWRVSELRGVCNRPAPGKAIHAVQQWLHEAQHPQSANSVQPARNRKRTKAESQMRQLTLFG